MHSQVRAFVTLRHPRLIIFFVWWWWYDFHHNCYHQFCRFIFLQEASSFRTLRPVFQELLMMQDHTNILLSEATNHILNSKNSVEMLYDKPGPPYDSAKVDKNSKPGTYVYSKKKRELIF